MEPKFNLNREKISDEEINSKKDFGELVKQFKQQSIEKAKKDTNFIKNKKVTYSAIIAGATVICTITYFSVFKKQPPKQSVNDKTTTSQTISNSTQSNNSIKAFIAPPVAKLNTPYTSYKVKASEGATIKHPSNTKILIPKNAFVNKAGQDIVGEVEIKYREFHNQADIIASGIPMSYDSAGVKRQFESAGMFDIRGYQNGEPVFIHPNKIIKVEFASTQTADRYNIYELDTIAKNWTYISRDNSVANSSNKHKPAKASPSENELVSPKTKELQKQIDAIPPKIELEKNSLAKKLQSLPKTSEPLKPNKSNASRVQFQLDVNYKEFPELAAYKDAVFEVGTENKNYSSDISKITWNSAEIAEGPQKGKNYLLTLKYRERTENLVVYPTLSGASYENALSVYEKKYNEYKKLQAKKEADEKQLKEEFEAKQKAFIAEQKRLNDEMLRERIRIQKQKEEELNQKFNNMSLNTQVTRVFNVNRFGICNSDCPTNMPEDATLNPIFVLDNGKGFIKPQQIYLVSHTKNLVYEFRNEPIKYNLDDSYSLCVLAEGKLYTCDKETLSNNFKTKQNKIKVTELSNDVENAGDLKIALGI